MWTLYKRTGAGRAGEHSLPTRAPPLGQGGGHVLLLELARPPVRPPGIARYDGKPDAGDPGACRRAAAPCARMRRAALCRRVPVVAAGLLCLVRKVGLEQRHEVAVGIHDYCVLAGLALYNVAVHPYALGL